MRKSYSAAFQLGTRGDQALPSVLQEVRSWLDTPSRGLDLGPDPLELLQDPHGDHRVADGHRLETRIHEDEATHAWSLRYTHPDRNNPHLIWSTCLAWRRTGSSKAPWFGAQVLYGSNDGTVVPFRRQSSRPRLIPELVKRLGACNGRELHARSTPLDKDGAASFVAELESQDRRLPIVFLSASNATDRPVVDPDHVANLLVGVAHVHHAKDRFTTLYGLEKLLPREHLAFDGTVRIYWPGFRRDAQPYLHRYWTVRDIRAIGTFEPMLLQVVSGATIGVTHPEAPTWDAVEFIQREAQIRRARESGSEEELLALMDEENAQLRHRIEQLELRELELEGSLSDTEAQRDSYRQNYEILLRGEAETEDASAPTIHSVSDAISEAVRLHEGSLLIAFNSQSDGHDSPYGRPLEVYEALCFLADTYAPARRGESRIKDFDTPLRERCGWEWKGFQSKTTMGRFSSHYETKHKGRSVQLDQHLGRGSNKDPRFSIRIGFTWLEDEGKVLIGFLGQHQRTTAT